MLAARAHRRLSGKASVVHCQGVFGPRSAIQRAQTRNSRLRIRHPGLQRRRPSGPLRSCRRIELGVEFGFRSPNGDAGSLAVMFDDQDISRFGFAVDGDPGLRRDRATAEIDERVLVHPVQCSDFRAATEPFSDPFGRNKSAGRRFGANRERRRRAAGRGSLGAALTASLEHERVSQQGVGGSPGATGMPPGPRECPARRAERIPTPQPPPGRAAAAFHAGLKLLPLRHIPRATRP